MKSFLATLINRLTRTQKRSIQILIDVVLIAFACWLAFQFRLGFGYNFNADQIFLMAVSPLTAVPIFIRFGLYRAVLRYLPERAIWSIFKAVTFAVLGWMAIVFASGRYGITGVPRSIPFLFWLNCLVLISFTRFAAKWYLIPNPGRKKRYQTLIYGAGDAGRQLASALASSDKYRVIGFVDDDTSLAGQDVAGLRVYNSSHIATLVENFGISTIMLCIPSASSARKLHVGAMLAKLPVAVQTIPSITDIASGRYVFQQSRDVNVEELIGRSTVPPDATLISSVLAGKKVLVTGGGGSIGSSLAKLIARESPRELVLVDNNEFSLYEAKMAISDQAYTPNTIFKLASVTDEKTMQQLFEAHRFDIVFHAAAFKHVNMVEENPEISIRNNICGTEIVSRLAYETGVDLMVFISTDKAVNPTNVMGATKRVGELIVRRYAENALAEKTGQTFLSVRFGNVVGSRGSVVPRFTEQIRKGGPVTVTDKNMTRFFMATSEATELIVQAAGMSAGGETFLLEMGDPISIYQLARDMIALSGLQVRDDLNPNGDIEIVITGAQPGEKIHEDLLYDNKAVKPTSHPKIVKVTRKFNAHEKILDAVDDLLLKLDQPDVDCRRALFDMLEDVQNRAFSTSPDQLDADASNRIVAFPGRQSKRR